MRELLGLDVVLMCLVALAWPPAKSTIPSVEQIDAIFSAVTAPGAPGLAVLVRKDDRVVFERGYGVRDMATRTKIDAATNFRLASCTKQFTAMAILLLVHDHKVTYETRLTDVFPDFPEYGRSITIRNLLNHTSGLLDYESLMEQQDPNTPPEKMMQIRDTGVLALLKQQSTTKFPPGTKWDYSNSGYVVLGLIVDRVSGEPFGDFLHDRIFVPLKMQNTLAFEKGENRVPHRAFGYTKNGRAWQETDQSPTSATLGDGGV
jgi:CubicO group peptidase (beta-lactamase class C family)